MRKAMLLAILFCLVATTPAMAQEATKIGVISLRKVLLESNAGKSAHGRLKKALQGESSTLEKEKASLEKSQEEFKKLAVTMSQEGKAKQARELQRKIMDHGAKVQAFQKKAVEEEARLMNPIKEKLVEVIHKYAQENKFTLVLTDTQGGVVYAARGIDITNPVMDAFNKAYR